MDTMHMIYWSHFSCNHENAPPLLHLFSIHKSFCSSCSSASLRAAFAREGGFSLGRQIRLSESFTGAPNKDKS